MIANDRQLSTFRDITGKVPKVGDKVLVISNHHSPELYTVAGIHTSNLHKHHPLSEIVLETGRRDKWRKTSESFEKTCFILDEQNKIIWQYNK